MSNNDNVVLTMEERYGPIIGGKHLYSALGFKTYAAFYRSQQRGEVGVNVFTLDNRKGWFAKTAEVGNWIIKQSEKGGMAL